MKKFYVTTPIYYINDVPHIGHAYTSIAADVLSRYHRKKGDEVFFLTGTDEHGAKIAEAAAKAGKTPQEFADMLSPKFREMSDKLGISYSEFFRTTNHSHERLVQDFVGKLKDKGFVEKRQYEGLYCVGCEKFLKESELVDGLCPDHKKVPVVQSEENYFFKLSFFVDQLIEKIEAGELRIRPESRQNEILGKLKQGLEDISISRQAVEWGVPFPGDEAQTIYVWIDALLNYYTATKIYQKEDFWPANIHLIGKDILWFHAVIWPAMLLAAELPLPHKVFANGYFTINGQKMSKSIGNVIDPNEMVDRFGADAVRYALLREIPFGQDGDISVEKIASHYNSLANNIGNLLQRTIAMINKYFDESQKLEIKSQKGNLDVNIDGELEHLDFMEALRKIDEVAMMANRLIAERQPWVLAKEGKAEELCDTLGKAYADLVLIADLVEAFMPNISSKMKSQLESMAAEPIFPRLESNNH
jgi:methionyl-tRNA synthetase